MSCSTPDGVPDFDDGSADREHPLRLSARLHPQCQPQTGRAGHPEEHHHADRRRLRRDAADRQADAGAGDVSLPVRLHRQGRRHREGRHRAGSDLLDLLRRAVHAAPSVRIRQSAARADRRARRRLLAGQHRLDRRRLSASAGACRSRRPARCSPPRSTARSTTAEFRTDAEFRLRGAGRRCRRRRSARSSTRARPGPTSRPTTARRRRLVGMFVANFAKFEAHVDAAVLGAAPSMLPPSSRVAQPSHRQDRRGRAFSFVARRVMTARMSARRHHHHRDEAVDPRGRSGREFHPLVRARRPERQQGRDRGAAALRRRQGAAACRSACASAPSSSAGQQATKDGVIVIEAGASARRSRTGPMRARG